MPRPSFPTFSSCDFADVLPTLPPKWTLADATLTSNFNYFCLLFTTFDERQKTSKSLDLKGFRGFIGILRHGGFEPPTT